MGDSLSNQANELLLGAKGMLVTCLFAPHGWAASAWGKACVYAQKHDSLSLLFSLVVGTARFFCLNTAQEEVCIFYGQKAHSYKQIIKDTI